MFKETKNIENHKQKAYSLIRDIDDKIDFYPAANIAGFDDDEAWKIRDESIERNPSGVVQGLAGIETDKAWEIRESLIEVCPHSVARSLVGLDTKEAWEMREKLLSMLDKDGVANGLAESVAFLDNQKAWDIRYRLENVCLGNVFEGLNGVDSEEAWNFREKYQETHSFEVVSSLIGINSARANKTREMYKNKNQIKGLIFSYMNNDSEEAWELRDKYLDKFPFIVGTSLAGIESERAWRMREVLKKRAEDENREDIFKGVAQSISPYMFTPLKK